MLQLLFLGHVSNTVLTELGEVLRMELTGFPRVRCLEALRARATA